MVQIKTEPWTGGTEEEYETKRAKRLKRGVRQMIEMKIISRIKDMETSLKESWELNDTDKTTIKYSCDKLIKMYYERAEPSLEIIDGEIESALKIPSNVLLPGDEVQKEDVSSVDHKSFKKEVAGAEPSLEIIDGEIESTLKIPSNVLLPGDEVQKEDVSSVDHKSLKKEVAGAEPSLEIIDGEIESTLKIPSNVLLPGDEVQKEDVSSVDHESVKKEVAGLRKRVELGAMMEALLLAEEEELASVEKVGETANKDMEVLDLLHKSIDNNGNLKSIQNDTEFLCASAPFMKKTDESGLFDD